MSFDVTGAASLSCSTKRMNGGLDRQLNRNKVDYRMHVVESLIYEQHQSQFR